MGVPATTRATPYIYNDIDDIAALVDGVVAARDFYWVSR